MKLLKTVNSNTKKQAGFVQTTELILLATTMVAGLVIGLATLRDSVTAELEDVAEAIGALDQSYAFDGMINAQNTAEVSGSGFIDAVDVNAGDGATFQFIASDFTESAVSIGNTPSPGSASPSVSGGSLGN